MSTPCLNEKELERLANSEKTLFEAIDSRVKWTIFWSIMGSIIGVLIIVVGNIYSQLDNVHANDKVIEEKIVANSKDADKKIGDINIAQAKIDVQYVAIMKTLSEIKIELAKLK